MKRSKKQTAHANCLAYMRGWHKGAGCHPFSVAEMDNVNFATGWKDGKAASAHAQYQAEEAFGTELRDYLELKGYSAREASQGANEARKQIEKIPTKCRRCGCPLVQPAELCGECALNILSQ